ncbi:MAG: aromatic acid exporter family protein [Defluviitaleaceae bacterium]|nr:aromatic acid exporter family protein [Defluviitaleaceae bacterium]
MVQKMSLPGFRTIKTGIAVLLCLFIYNVIGRDGAIFAIMAVLICMQDSVEKSIKEGINRTIGTIIGATFGTIFVFTNLYFLNIFLYDAIIVIVLILLIHICHLIGIRKSIVIATIVYMVIMLGADENPIMYSIDRTIDTLFGIIIAVIINISLFRPNRAKQVVHLIIKNGDENFEIDFKNYITEETRSKITYKINLEDIQNETLKNIILCNENKKDIIEDKTLEENNNEF